jgi:class 3 adenylate cyclase
MSNAAVVTLLFRDLIGSTDLLTSLGHDANDEVRRALLRCSHGSARDHHGVVVKPRETVGRPAMGRPQRLTTPGVGDGSGADACGGSSDGASLAADRQLRCRAESRFRDRRVVG